MIGTIWYKNNSQAAYDQLGIIGKGYKMQNILFDELTKFGDNDDIKYILSNGDIWYTMCIDLCDMHLTNVSLLNNEVTEEMVEKYKKELPFYAVGHY